eukprot:g70338.t1
MGRKTSRPWSSQGCQMIPFCGDFRFCQFPGSASHLTAASVPLVKRSIVDRDTATGASMVCNKVPAVVQFFGDMLDHLMGWSKDGTENHPSGLRGFLHGSWHWIAGFVTGNKWEFERAKWQWAKMKGDTRPWM